MNDRLNYVKHWASEAGLYVDTWAPGDGITRYRFGTGSDNYFAMHAVYTALGIKEAETFARGLRAGLDKGQK